MVVFGGGSGDGCGERGCGERGCGERGCGERGCGDRDGRGAGNRGERVAVAAVVVDDDNSGVVGLRWGDFDTALPAAADKVEEDADAACVRVVAAGVLLFVVVVDDDEIVLRSAEN